MVVTLLLEFAGRGPLPDVSVEPVTREALESWIATNGKVEPLQPYVLRSRLDTFVTRVLAVEGQAVKRGQLLLDLDSTSAAAQLAEARQKLLTAQHQLQDARAGGAPDQLAELASDLAKAQASRDRLSAQQKTLAALVAGHAATQDELDQNALKLAQAEADLGFYQQKQQAMARLARYNVDQAGLRIEQARVQISDLSEKVASARLLAPVDGTVYALPVRKGDYVHVGQELADTADLLQVRVRAYVDEVDLGALEANQSVQIQWDAIPGRVWTGRTEVVPKQVVPYRDRNVGEVLCSVSNSDLRLLPNTNVDVRIRVEKRTGSLVVPRAAVQSEGTARYVFVVQDGRLRRRPIRVGIASTTRFEVLDGLQEGELVAMPGSVNLSDGLLIHAVQVR